MSFKVNLELRELRIACHGRDGLSSCDYQRKETGLQHEVMEAGRGL